MNATTQAATTHGSESGQEASRRNTPELTIHWVPVSPGNHRTHAESAGWSMNKATPTPP